MLDHLLMKMECYVLLVRFLLLLRETLRRDMEGSHVCKSFLLQAGFQKKGPFPRPTGDLSGYVAFPGYDGAAHIPAAGGDGVPVAPVAPSEGDPAADPQPAVSYSGGFEGSNCVDLDDPQAPSHEAPSVGARRDSGAVSCGENPRTGAPRECAGRPGDAMEPSASRVDAAAPLPGLGGLIDRDFDGDLQVCVRVRPLLEHEARGGATTGRLAWDPEAGRVSALGRGPRRHAEEGGQAQAFGFDRVFGPEASQEGVFEGCRLEALLGRVLDGFHATVFAYGQTGSGKTYTMEGVDGQGVDSGDAAGRGLAPRAVLGLFRRVEQSRLASSDVLTVKLSFLQLYQEQVYDLLNPVHAGAGAPAGAGRGLRLRWNPHQSAAVVENLFVFECSSAAEALGFYRAGVRSRAVASHKMNQASSRSHCILTLTVERSSTEGSDLRVSKLTLVDLAGSERQSGTGATGQTFRESISINQSLFVLRKVITALAQRQGSSLAPLPYRESKLTTLLRDAVGGSSFTLMMACLSPSDAHLDENLSTLHYAATASRIRNRPTVNLDPKSRLIQQLRGQVRSLSERLAAAHAYVVRVTGRPLPAELAGEAAGAAGAPGELEAAPEAPWGPARGHHAGGGSPGSSARSSEPGPPPARAASAALPQAPARPAAAAAAATSPPGWA
ncbi:unnamed protein product, partial [Prorocentrum cordatum]